MIGQTNRQTEIIYIDEYSVVGQNNEIYISLFQRSNSQNPHRSFLHASLHIAHCIFFKSGEDVVRNTVECGLVERGVCGM